MTAKIAVLVSGGGTNLQALIDARQRGELGGGEITAVISSKEGAYALERARKAGIPGYVLPRKDFDSNRAMTLALVEKLKALDIDLVVLAGCMVIFTEELVQAYPNAIMNVHPALIPSFCGQGFYGLRVHEAALAYGVKLSGATVHFVSAECDGGPIIAQKAVPVLPGDTPEILQKRIMEQAEWKLLPEAVRLFCAGGRPHRYHRTGVKSAMNVYEIKSMAERLSGNTYPGRGIVLGVTPDGKTAVAAYFIMGRSVNSRNRVFVQEPDGIRTEAFDPGLMKDPHLIIYHPVREAGQGLIVTNGDQTDTVWEYLAKGESWEAALRTRQFEDDAPNWTPRISGLQAGDGSYKLSILKSADPEGAACARFFYEYPAVPGLGHFLHTYVCDGNPVIPTFQGEPERVSIPGDIDDFTRELWENLNPDNKISLFVRYTNLETRKYQQRILNKHVK